MGGRARAGCAGRAPPSLPHTPTPYLRAPAPSEACAARGVGARGAADARGGWRAATGTWNRGARMAGGGRGGGSASDTRSGAGPSRDLSAARAAYSSVDVEASIAAHNLRAAGDHAEGHSGEGGKYVKSLVYGGLDGIITTFAIVAATVGGDQSRNLVITLGFANLLADGISMGLGDYLSEKSEVEYIKQEEKVPARDRAAVGRRACAADACWP